MDDQDLCAHKEKVQSSTEGKDLTLKSICATRGNVFGESPVSIHLIIKVLSCQSTEYCNESKFNGNNRNNMEATTRKSC